jgi:hypothetical protein
MGNDEAAAHHARGLPWGPEYKGPDPLTVRRMSRLVLANITVHLANEHKINSDSVPFEQHQHRHAWAHTYGEFRAGQEHYHTTEK